MHKKLKYTLLIGIPVLILIIASVAGLVILKEKNNRSQQVPAPGPFVSEDAKRLSNSLCEGEAKPKLTHFPMSESDFPYIIPYGMMIDSHVTPIDHQYFQPKEMRSKRDSYPVYAMAEAKLVDIGKRENPGGDFEYRLVFSMSCKLFYYYDLVTGLTPEVLAQMGGKDYAAPNYEVKAGQQIGWIGGRTLDFAVWDMDTTLPGFIVPEHYLAEPWKIHTADPLLYYTDELKAKVLAKYIRTVEPLSGKIDYDIDGKLIGSWFAEGNNGFGKTNEPDMDAHKGHVSISPDYLDPESYVVSLGDYKGEPEQFGIKGNAPNPQSIGVESGVIKFELVQKDWVDSSGNMWDRMSFKKGLKAKNQNFVIATALFQLTEKRKLKVEIFPDKKASDATGFTANAKMYER